MKKKQLKKLELKRTAISNLALGGRDLASMQTVDINIYGDAICHSACYGDVVCQIYIL